MVNVNVGEVAPGTSVKVVPPSVDTCHCTVGAGLPVAAAVKVTDWPWSTSWPEGFAATVGAVSTVSVAGSVVSEPSELANTARYWLPSSVAAASTSRVVLFAPTMGANVVPPSVETSHWTSGTGLPLPDALNVAVWPASTVVGVGDAVTEAPVPTKP